MTYRPEMRASDEDREKIASRIRDAHTEGRLSGEEFYDRLDALYKAQTYGELEPLVRDIPVSRTHKTPEIVKPTAQQPANPRPSGRTGGDTAMAVLWSIWAAAVAINLVIWGLVSATNGLHYFWPMWVAGPSGAALFSVELIRRVYRRSR